MPGEGRRAARHCPAVPVRGRPVVGSRRDGRQRYVELGCGRLSDIASLRRVDPFRVSRRRPGRRRSTPATHFRLPCAHLGRELSGGNKLRRRCKGQPCVASFVAGQAVGRRPRVVLGLCGSGHAEADEQDRAQAHYAHRGFRPVRGGRRDASITSSTRAKSPRSAHPSTEPRATVLSLRSRRSDPCRRPRSLRRDVFGGSDRTWDDISLTPASVETSVSAGARHEG